MLAPSLNARGIEQCRFLAKQLAGRTFGGIFSSDSARARETAAILCDTLKLEVAVDKRLREIHLGEWEGLRDDEIRAGWPQDLVDRERNPLTSRAPGGESVMEVAARSKMFADEIALMPQQAPLIVVSHLCTLATLVLQAEKESLAGAYGKRLPGAEPFVIIW